MADMEVMAMVMANPVNTNITNITDAILITDVS